jgi:hypothetical protein
MLCHPVYARQSPDRRGHEPLEFQASRFGGGVLGLCEIPTINSSNSFSDTTRVSGSD